MIHDYKPTGPTRLEREMKKTIRVLWANIIVLWLFVAFLLWQVYG